MEREKLDFFTKSDIYSGFDNIAKILETDIFSPENSNSPFVHASFIYVLIHLRDLMYKSIKYAHKRIDFTDDVVQFEIDRIKVSDVTDLIQFVRNAICHPETTHHYLDDDIKATYNIVYGKGNLMSFNGISLKSNYSDDVCFFFGKAKIYLNRHIIRAYYEAKEALQPLL